MTLRLRRTVERDEFSSQIEHTVTIYVDNSPFERISVSEIEQSEVTLLARRTKDRGKTAKQRVRKYVLETAYLPAYRNVIDAWKSTTFSAEKHIAGASNIRRVNLAATDFSRRWLVPFVPEISVESLVEIERSLELASVNHQFDVLARYLDSINRFLDRKQVYVAKPPFGPLSPPVQVIFENGLPSKGLSALSSGERQIAILLYATTQIKGDDVILIDEPEISLHVDWQRQLLKEMAGQLFGKQIIVCTHSPVIAADFEDQMMEIGYTSGSEYEHDQEIPFYVDAG